MTGVFTLEAVLKIVASGFVINGKRSYLRNAANVLDFFIVVSAIISTSTDANIGFFKSLRTVRVLRPFRVISRLKKLGIVLQAIYFALPRVINLQLVVLFFMYVFAIMLTTIFSGTSQSCYMDQASISALQ